MAFIGCYAIIVRSAMIGMWAVSLMKRQVPELSSEPVRIGFHLAAEFATAVALIVGGSALLADTSWAIGVSLASMGMLLYTILW